MPWPTHIVAAAGYALDESDNLLMVKTYHRGWDVPGGQIEIGESIDEGLLREILEESGITARVGPLVGVYSNTCTYLARDGVTPIPSKVMFDFLCTPTGGAPTPSDETSEVLWVPREKALPLVTAPAQRYRFEKALAYAGKPIYATYVTRPDFQVLSERWL